MSAYQHILRLDIAVDELLLVRVLQGGSDLLHGGNNLSERNDTPLGIVPPQRAIGGVVHHQKRHPVLYIIIQDAHNGGMHQLRNRLGLLVEVLGLLAGQVGVQHLDRRLQSEPHMLP